ncbi:MAG TPA: hypothetical protein VGO50_00340 [Pyrinomonadaceae bacterium]|jgi:hypothetical protein|nr:hypothetical protein [Pyrinomonadaceae bacterium]
MKFLKLFTLLALLIGVWAIGSKPVGATDCYQEYVWCLADAEGDRGTCYEMCNGIIACEVVCNMKYDNDVAECEFEYGLCLNP